jgi:hypothetical protein
MDATRSDFGGAPGPEAFTRTIEHKEPSLIMTDEQIGAAGSDKAVRKYTTDAKEITYQWMGSVVKSAAHWESDSLIVTGKIDAGGTEIIVNSILNLSADGKTLTENDNLVAGGNEVGAFKIVLVRK